MSKVKRFVMDQKYMKKLDLIATRLLSLCKNKIEMSKKRSFNNVKLTREWV